MAITGKVVFHVRYGLIRFSKGTRLFRFMPLCTSTNTNKTNNGDNGNNSKTVATVKDDDAYRQLEKLDFMTAAKILFTNPPKKKKFGIDFHLVQLFFACMPSLAVYLVAQYARYEIRRMEAEVELKKKKAEEEKAKEMESSALEESEETGSDPDLLKVKVRLDALEETVKEIADETKKLLGSDLAKNKEGSKREQQTSVSDVPSKSEGATNSRISSSIPVESTEGLNQKKQQQHKGAGKIENGESSQELKK